MKPTSSTVFKFIPYHFFFVSISFPPRRAASELAGWRSTCDKRMATITAGVNLLNNKLHDYQTENARELANQVSLSPRCVPQTWPNIIRFACIAKTKEETSLGSKQQKFYL
jgi:hypothetical protein